MPIRLTAQPVGHDVQLVMPVGRHLESPHWWIAAQVLGQKFIVRAWVAAHDGFRVIVLDRDGSELGSMLSKNYDTAIKALGVSGPTNHIQVEGRRLVSGGDKDWEVAAEIHNVADERLLYLRIWVQARQRFVLYVIDCDGAIRDRATGDYKQAKQRALSHLLA